MSLPDRIRLVHDGHVCSVCKRSRDVGLIFTFELVVPDDTANTCSEDTKLREQAKLLDDGCDATVIARNVVSVCLACTAGDKAMQQAFAAAVVSPNLTPTARLLWRAAGVPDDAIEAMVADVRAEQAAIAQRQGGAT